MKNILGKGLNSVKVLPIFEMLRLRVFLIFQKKTSLIPEGILCLGQPFQYLDDRSPKIVR